MRRINSAAFRIATRGTSREINRRDLAQSWSARSSPSRRADLARLMGLPPGAVSLLVNDLLRAGLVFEGAKGESRGGRKPRHL